MNKLLIHNNNTSFNRTELFSIEEQFVFDVDFDKDVDLYINENLDNGDLKKKLENVDIIFIKVSLSQNYLEYLGIRLSYHIRLTKSLGAKSLIPIVFIAEESIQFLGLTYSEPSILFTGGIYLIKEKLENYTKVLELFAEGKIKSLDNFSHFIESIFVSPPANYQSHHSIANEWALFRYFSMFKKDEKNVKYIALNKKILQLDYVKTLYFKYLERKVSRQNFNPKKHIYTPSLSAVQQKTIGIIDDEINKGWMAFYDYFFDGSAAKTYYFNDFRKEENRENQIIRIQNWLTDNIKANNAIDMYIIDLRLHDDDFSEVDFDKISGVQIIKYIKCKNPGIQIVVSTASNKVWNFQKCLRLGVSHFAIKESPETYNSREESIFSLNHLSKEITKASNKTFVAEVYRKISTLKSENIFISDSDNKNIQELVFEKNGLLDQILNLLIIDSNSDSIINQCLLLCFQILENYCDLSTISSFGNDNRSGSRLSSGFVWLKSNEKKDIFINQPNQKISTWFELKEGKFDIQNENTNETPTSFEVFPEMKIVSAYHSGLDASSMVKMISVLYFRDNISKIKIERIMELRYYRSNVAAHLTGKVKSNQKISSNDIVFFIELFFFMFKLDKS